MRRPVLRPFPPLLNQLSAPLLHLDSRFLLGERQATHFSLDLWALAPVTGTFHTKQFTPWVPITGHFPRSGTNLCASDKSRKLHNFRLLTRPGRLGNRQWRNWMNTEHRAPSDKQTFLSSKSQTLAVNRCASANEAICVLLSGSGGQ